MLFLIKNNFRYIYNIFDLYKEAGERYLLIFVCLNFLKTFLEISGLGILAGYFFNSPNELFYLGIKYNTPQAFFSLLILVFIRGLIKIIITSFEEKVRNSFADKLRSELFTKVLYATSNDIGKIGRGELLGLLVTDINRSVNALNQSILSITALISIIAFSFGILFISKNSAIGLFLGLIASFLAFSLRKQDNWTLGTLQSNLNNSVQKTLGDGLFGLKSVKAASAEKWLIQRFDKETAQFRRIREKLLIDQSLLNGLRDLFVVLIVGIWLFLTKENLSQFAIASTLIFVYRVATSTGNFINSQRFCIASLPGYQNLKVLRTKIKTNQSNFQIKNKILFKDLNNITHFTWSTNSKNIKVKKLKASKGFLLIIKGKSGIGKTTLIDNIVGLRDEIFHKWIIKTDKKSLVFDGLDGLQFVRNLISYSPQDTFLFEGTIKDNLLFSSNNLESKEYDEQINYWCNKLNIEKLISDHGGINNYLNMSLNNFSGGETKILAFLRTVLKDKEIEIYDEPTAFMDNKTSSLLRDIIIERKKNKIIIIATHDKLLIKEADKVLNIN